MSAPDPPPPSAATPPPEAGSAGRAGWCLIVVPGLLAIVLLGLLWLGGLVWFAGSVPLAGMETGRAEAIVVLTGGSERVRTGLDVLEANPAATLFISGVPARVGVDDLWRALGVAPSARVTDRVELGHAAADTRGNARETAAWIRRTGHHSVRLITAAYHMRRALLELRAQMPEVRFLPDPVFPPHVKQDEWWRYPGTAALLATEFNKYLAAWLRVTLGLGETAGAPRAFDSGAS